MRRKIYRRRKRHFASAWSWCKALLVIASLLILLLFKTHSVKAEEDWTNSCPSNCKCTWVGGQKTAGCHGSGFKTIPTGLSQKLKVLDLSFNSISQLNKNEFEKRDLANLHKVFLRSCQIEKIHREAFHNLKVLIELDLTGNKLESLEMEAFESNRRLRELRLRDNPLTKLLGVQFPPLLDLQLLDLRNCQLSQLSKNTFDKLSNLEQLDLTGNKFQYISEQVFKPLSKLKSLSLENNPWKCDCRLKKLRDWIIAQKLGLPITCAERIPMENFQPSLLHSIDFVCQPEMVALQVNGQASQNFIAYADVGNDISLQCLVRADPAPEVNWFRGGQFLANSSGNHGKVYLVHSSGKYERWVNLTILKSDVDDAGEYSCVGSNAGGVVEYYLTLNIQSVQPNGTGEEPGLGGEHGPLVCHDHTWLWMFNGFVSSAVVIIFVIVTVSFCKCKRRVRNARVHNLEMTHRMIFRT